MLNKNDINNLKNKLENIKTEKIRVEKDLLLDELDKLRQRNSFTLEEMEHIIDLEKKLDHLNIIHYKPEAAVEEDIRLQPEILLQETEKLMEEQKETETVRVPKIDISISDDEIRAYISVKIFTDSPDVSYEKIKKAIEKNNITRGILDKNIYELLDLLKTEKEVSLFLVAQGEMPMRGKNAELRFQFEHDPDHAAQYLTEKWRIQNRTFRSDEEFKKAVGQYLAENQLVTGSVKKGQIIAAKTLPEKGNDGFTVTGNILPGLSGEDIEITLKRNIKYDPKNNVYISEIDGIAVFENNIFWVKMYKQGSFNIDVSADKMQAFLTITPSLGGAGEVKLEDILKETGSLGITSLIDRDLILKYIKDAETGHKLLYKIPLCSGVLPEHGENAYLDYKIRFASGMHVKENEDGSIDFKEKDMLTHVKKEALIAVLHKETPGQKDGQDIFGNKIPAEPGKPLNMQFGNNIDVQEKADTVVLYSKIDGHLKIFGNELSVAHILTINSNVDFSTGNVRFNGDVIIQGDILDDFLVEAEGDILINGSVGSAQVISRGNILVRNGFNGRHKGKLISQGKVTVKFIENGIIEARDSVVVQRAAINSSIYSNNKIYVKTEKGQISGGVLFAGRMIEANTVGTASGVKTEIFLGYNFQVYRELMKAREDKDKTNFDLQKVEGIMQKVQKSNKDLHNLSEDMKRLYVETLRKKVILMNYLKSLRQKEEELNDTLLYVCRDPELVVHDTLFTDIKIHYLNKVIEINEIYKTIKIIRSSKDDQVVFQTKR